MMDDKIQKLSAIFMSVLVFTVSITVTSLSAAENVTGNEEAKELETEKISGMELMENYTAQAEEAGEELEHQIRIELPKGMTLDEIKVENDVLSRLLSIIIPGIDQTYYYNHPLLGSSNHIDDLTLGSSQDAGLIEIFLDEVYEIEATVTDSWLCLDFIPPRELYEKVLVIDAGHGGGQPGAVKQGIYEKELNLSILLELKELLDQHEEWKVYYTRTDDSDVSLDDRVQLANKSHANLFVSIHNNSTRTGEMLDFDGTEVMYDEKEPEEPLGTKALSQILVDELTAVTGSRNLGLARGNSIYIIRNSQPPVGLIEVGFMTSPEELEKLSSKEYQQKVAQGIYNGILRAFEEGF